MEVQDADIIYAKMQIVEFYLKLPSYQCINPNNIHLCFPMQIKTSTREANNVGDKKTTVNNLFAHCIKETAIRRLDDDLQIIRSLSIAIYRLSGAMLEQKRKKLLVCAENVDRRQNNNTSAPANRPDLNLTQKYKVPKINK